jgi:hypothetical protein
MNTTITIGPVFHLFEFWTGHSAHNCTGNVSFRIIGWGAGPTGFVGLNARTGGGVSASGGSISDQLSDEDLLD